MFKALYNHVEHESQLLSVEIEEKYNQKDIASCLIPCQLVVFMWQLEILVTALSWTTSSSCLK